MMAEMAGETPNEEDVRQVLMSQGGKPAQEAVSEIIKVQEAAKERPLEERRVAVQEKGIPLEERKVAVSEGQLKARWKELAGQLGDMTPKEAQKKIDKLEVEKRKYDAKANKTKDRWGDPVPEDEIKAAKSVSDEIKKEIEEIKSRFAPGKPDKFGFKLGETRTSPKGKVRYVGNNQWELVD
jgi:hypothetical protein